MSLRDSIDIDHLHHAYVVEGDPRPLKSELLALFSEGDIVAPSDLHVIEEDAFLLEHAHELRKEQTFHGVDGGRKIFLILFSTMTLEAQNALLKTLEEPTSGTHFFFITRIAQVLLPTLRSRTQFIQGTEMVLPEEEGQRFLSSSIPERLAQIEKLLKAKPEEKAQARERARSLLASLEQTLHDSSHGTNDPVTVQALRDVLIARQYAFDRSPSFKLLLDHLALTLPLERK